MSDIGINRPINLIVNAFKNELWKSVNSKEFYGMCSRNLRNGKIVAELYTGVNNEYKELYFDDKVNALFFFDTDDNVVNIANEPIREVRLICSINLKSIYPLLTHRATEEAHHDVISILKGRYSSWFELTRIDTGLEAYGNINVDNLKQYTMQPYYTFAIIMNVKYSYQCQI
jgi:hypothetical protein